MKIITCRGLPASGKSYWATAHITDHPTYKRISRDNLREMVDNRAWSQSKEKHIRRAELALAELFLANQCNIIVDDTNLSPSAQQMWQDFATKHTIPLEVQDFTDVPLEVCIARDKKRPNYVGEDVIRKMYHQYIYKAPIYPVIPLIYDAPYGIVADLDGTLCLMQGRNPYDAAHCEEDLLNEPVARVVWLSHQAGDIILLTSGRKEEHRPQTERWLARHEIPYHHLFMRPTGDDRQDAIVKREIYEQHIQGKYNIRFALDDRSRIINLWRSLGLTALQVAEGDF